MGRENEQGSTGHRFLELPRAVTATNQPVIWPTRPWVWRGVGAGSGTLAAGAAWHPLRFGDLI